MIELGMVYAIQQEINKNLSIYLIAENKIELPSNMSGYFVSVYKKEKNRVVFKDQNTLIMSIAFDVKDFYNGMSSGGTNDEINEFLKRRLIIFSRPPFKWWAFS